MILEIADIQIHPGRQAEFEAAVQAGIERTIARAPGFRGGQIRHSLESPERYVLLLEWETLEDHTVGFRGSPAFVEWRASVGEHFARAPYVEHFELVGIQPPRPATATQSEAVERPPNGLDAA